MSSIIILLLHSNSKNKEMTSQEGSMKEWNYCTAYKDQYTALRYILNMQPSNFEEPYSESQIIILKINLHYLHGPQSLFSKTYYKGEIVGMKIVKSNGQHTYITNSLHKKGKER